MSEHPNDIDDIDDLDGIGHLDGPEELPELAAALRGLEPSAPQVPPTVDQAIRDAARAQFGARPGGTIRLLPWISVAAAACVAVAAGLWAWDGRSPAPAPGLTGPPAPEPAQPAAAAPAAVAITGDINEDGRLDIIDAYLLARFVHRRDSAAGQAPAGRGWDRNGDGAVDSSDAIAIAQAAVALPDRSMK